MSLPACIYNNDYGDITMCNKNIRDDNVPHIPPVIIPNKPNMVNIDRLEDINSRISERNLPSSYLQQQFSMRPISTKYASTMPILDGRAKATVPIIYKQPYQIGTTFNPGSSSPFVGYASNVNDESRLRNQFFGLQHCEQSVYVPKSNSDMYMVKVSGGHRSEPMLFPNLFVEPEMEAFNPNTVNVGKNFFENNTRVQLKNNPEKYSQQQHQTQAINRKIMP
jgi:hypothetical protein